jgi:hypothetical protein
VKLEALVAVPPGVVTFTSPELAAAGTVALIREDDLTENEALTPLNVTADAPAKLVPLILTVVPTPPLLGLKLVIVGVAASAAEAPERPNAVTTNASTTRTMPAVRLRPVPVIELEARLTILVPPTLVILFLAQPFGRGPLCPHDPDPRCAHGLSCPARRRRLHPLGAQRPSDVVPFP